MANTSATITTNRTKSTVLTTSTPVVSKIIQGSASIGDITGVSIDYNTIENNYTLVYNASSNTFVANTFSVDGGLYNNGTF